MHHYRILYMCIRDVQCVYIVNEVFSHWRHLLQSESECDQFPGSLNSIKTLVHSCSSYITNVHEDEVTSYFHIHGNHGTVPVQAHAYR